MHAWRTFVLGQQYTIHKPILLIKETHFIFFNLFIDKLFNMSHTALAHTSPHHVDDVKNSCVYESCTTGSMCFFLLPPPLVTDNTGKNQINVHHAHAFFSHRASDPPFLGHPLLWTSFDLVCRIVFLLSFDFVPIVGCVQFDQH